MSRQLALGLQGGIRWGFGGRGEDEVGLTVSASVEIDDTPYSHIDDTKEALVLLFEFLLVKDLYREHAVLGDPPAHVLVLCWRQA